MHPQDRERFKEVSGSSWTSTRTNRRTPRRTKAPVRKEQGIKGQTWGGGGGNGHNLPGKERRRHTASWKELLQELLAEEDT
jgi:hypothetical protein